MRFRRPGHHDLSRRRVRSAAFRATELNKVLRAELGPWFKDMGFKQLGSTGWVRSVEGEYQVVAVQAGQSGWDPHSGNRFVVEFERSERPIRATGFSRRRIWGLLDEGSRQEALRINDRVAETLPPPNKQILRELPQDLRQYYLAHFERTAGPVEATTDVWFAYYDDVDASDWATFLARSVPLAFASFLRESPSV